MSREIDERKKRKALRKLRKAALLAEQGLGPPLSDWERQFLEEVEERIETYGSAFADLDKGGRDEPLSALQSQKLREIDKKARGKGVSKPSRRSSFKSKVPKFQPNVRQLDEDLPAPEPAKPSLVSSRGPNSIERRIKNESKRPVLRVIKGGQD